MPTTGPEQRAERRVSKVEPRRICCLELATVPTAVGLARLHAADVCRKWRIPQTIETAELLVSELVTNAICHTSKDVRRVVLTLVLTLESLFIEVFDHDPRPPIVREPGPTEESGRGLFLVAALSQDWNYYLPTDGGKFVWCELSLTPTGDA